MATGALLLSLLPAAGAWTRYNPAEGVNLASDLALATRNDVTPLASFPVQDGLYWWLSVTHFYVAVPVLTLMCTQWVRKKGDSIHVSVGFIIKWTLVFFLLQGFTLHLRHSFLSDDGAAFVKYPSIFDQPLQRPAASFFGFGISCYAAHAFWIGIKDETRRVGLHTPAFYFIRALSILTWVTGIWMYIVAIRRLFTEPVATFKWEISLEGALGFSILFIYDATVLWAMAGWAKTGELQWKEHHHMCATWFTSVALSAVLIFLAHDARHVFAYPGVHSIWLRLAIQLVPQFVLYAFTLPRIFAYLKTCGPSQDKRTMINEMAEQS